MKFSLKVSKSIKIGAIAGTAIFAIAGTTMAFAGGIQYVSISDLDHSTETSQKYKDVGLGWMNYNAKEGGAYALEQFSELGVTVVAANPIEPTYAEILKTSNDITPEIKKLADTKIKGEKAFIDTMPEGEEKKGMLEIYRKGVNAWYTIVDMNAMRATSIAGLVFMPTGIILLVAACLLLKLKSKATVAII